MTFLTRFFSNLNQSSNLRKNHHLWPRELTACFIFFVSLVLLNAWLGDDAYITFRTIKNFWSGYGLTYNITERVQAYTHPLWMLVVSTLYFFTREFFYTVTLLSVALTSFSVFFLISKNKNTHLSIFILWVLSFSKSFIDFSSSGLENPLSYLLLMLFFRRFFMAVESNKEAHSLSPLFFLAGLIMLNRMDLILLIAPSLLVITCKYSMKRILKPAFWGFAPFFAWELFSLFYYGFPFPNTAYAKLNTGANPIRLIQNGLQYLKVCSNFDPILTLCIPGILGLVLLRKSGRPFLYASSGILLHTLYVIKIGGDFMVGRFLTPSFFCSLIFLQKMNPPLKPKMLATLLFCIFFISASSRYTPLTDVFTAGSKPYQIGPFADEKKYYYLSAGLLPNLLNLSTPNYMSKTFMEPVVPLNPSKKPQVVLVRAAGFRLFEAGPNVHALDVYALTDPLLSKLPTFDKTYWRIGHFERLLPEGYVESLQTQTNKIKNPSLARYYDQLCLLTKGNLLNPSRIKAIIKMNLKQYDFYLKK